MMNAIPDMERYASVSPRSTARMAGALYLIIIVAALFAEVFVRGRLVVSGDAAATAANILAHQTLYRLGGAADLVTFLCDAAVALLFYELLKPVSRRLSLFAAAFRLVFAALVLVNTLNHFVPLVLLGGAPYLNAFRPDQLQALALAALHLHGTGYTIGLVVFGVHCVLLGWLIARSTFLPRVLGWLMALAGFCYLANSFAGLVYPPLQGHLYPYILLPAGVVEFSLCGWLLAVGVNVERWEQQAASQNSRSAG